MTKSSNAPEFLSAIRRSGIAPRSEAFPWSVPVIGGLEELEFRSQVTFLVGENGSGKSTLLEGLAAGTGAVAAGSADLERDGSLTAAREFAAGYRFIRRRHPRARLFVRAEDVFGFTRRVAGQMSELRALEKHFERELPEGSWGRTLAVGTVAGQRRALAGRYGENPDGRSHGETFLKLLQTRLVPQGLYFLDEPETPLSPSRVLGLISLLKIAVGEGSQFVIATHSPILMAFPDAEILLFENDAIRPVAWEEVEHVRLTRDFLLSPGSFLRHL